MAIEEPPATPKDSAKGDKKKKFLVLPAQEKATNKQTAEKLDVQTSQSSSQGDSTRSPTPNPPLHSLIKPRTAKRTLTIKTTRSRITPVVSPPAKDSPVKTTASDPAPVVLLAVEKTNLELEQPFFPRSEESAENLSFHPIGTDEPSSALKRVLILLGFLSKALHLSVFH